jgi:hypothetical protein
MNEGKSQPWYQLYAAAIVELDRKQLIERVDATENGNSRASAGFAVR